ncbi:glycoside hydrolase family 28 protein [Granulicella rosea]|nr:glycosyl hydrolase family 28 protein [Granulicella rosea]
MDRRSILKHVVGVGALAGPGIAAYAAAYKEDAEPEAESLNPRSFGAKGDGKTKDTAAIQRAIDTCSKRGGGVVYVSPGTYLTGSIWIKSNVNLHLSAGATLLGSPDIEDYKAPAEMQKPVTWVTIRHLILAFKETNVALTGRGTVDGSNHMYLAKSKNPPVKPEDRWHASSSAETERVQRISPMVEIAMCTNVLIEGVTLQNSVGWTLRPQGCYHVVIRGVKVRNAMNTQNTDGIDPTSCENVMISDCDVDTGDDALCIKSDNVWGENRICRNVTVTNCVLASACNGFKIGSEGYFGFQNITFSNSVVYSKPGRRDDERTISAINILMPDGGWIEGVTVSNITIRDARIAIFIRLQNIIGHKDAVMKSWLRSVMISNVQAFGQIVTSQITGIPDHPAEDITLRNIRLQTDEAGQAAWANNIVPEREHGYAEGTLFGRFPSFGLYCRHVNGLNLSDIDLVSTKSDPRPMIHFDDVNALSLRNVTGTPPSTGAETILMRDVTDAAITGNYPTAKNNVFVRVQGEKSAEISFFGNDLHRAKTPVALDANVPAGAVRVDGQSFHPA